jgi:hypothetical protein
MLNVTSLWGAECDTDYYLVIVEVRELLIRQQAARKMDVERFNLKKLSMMEVGKQ